MGLKEKFWMFVLVLSLTILCLIDEQYNSPHLKVKWYKHMILKAPYNSDSLWFKFLFIEVVLCDYHLHLIGCPPFPDRYQSRPLDNQPACTSQTWARASDLPHTLLNFVSTQSWLLTGFRTPLFLGLLSPIHTLSDWAPANLGSEQPSA